MAWPTFAPAQYQDYTLMQDKHLSDIKFSSLNLHPDLLKGIDAAGFEYCTPIQALALPMALNGEDVAGQAQTGTGKTAAFLLATMQRLILETEKSKAKEKKAEKKDGDKDGKKKGTSKKASAETDNEVTEKIAKKKDLKAIRSLILAPTRELAIQIHKDAVALSKFTNLKLGLAYGGTGYESQRKTIEDGVDILIGTPGRVIDYYKQGVFHLKNIQVAVMDEADRMFDLGFITDIRYLLRRMPEPASRLNLLFSATLSFRVDELAYEHMNAPKPVKVKSEMVVQRIEELAYYPAQNEKISLLINLLRHNADGRALVFINTKHEAAKIADWLNANDLDVAILSGDVAQDRREKLLKQFHDGKINILVATDVAARGLHIPDVSHVYNYDLPQDAEDYVHRTGRTARAGKSGHAISFICEKYAYSMMDIEAFIGHSLPIATIDESLLVAPENKPAFRERKTRDSRGRPTDRRPNTRASSSPSKHQSQGEERREYREPKPLVKPALAPDDIEDSKFVPPTSTHSKRFGEIPAVG